MRQDQFTTRFQELLGEAQSMAVERSQQYIDPLHLLLAVLKDTEGTEELKKEIQEYVKKNTAPYKYPRIVVFRDELPKTISGKIIRNKL